MKGPVAISPPSVTAACPADSVLEALGCDASVGVWRILRTTILPLRLYYRALHNLAQNVHPPCRAGAFHREEIQDRYDEKKTPFNRQPDLFVEVIYHENEALA